MRLGGGPEGTPYLIASGRDGPGELIGVPEAALSGDAGMPAPVPVPMPCVRIDERSDTYHRDIALGQHRDDGDPDAVRHAGDGAVPGFRHSAWQTGLHASCLRPRADSHGPRRLASACPNIASSLSHFAVTAATILG